MRSTDLFRAASVTLTLICLAATPAAAQTRASLFKLDNGLQIVVVPDHRAPVVTHMLWYRIGGMDDPVGLSGIAHFFEHLMFKGTAKIAEGDFSRIVARNGGQDNAFTSHDYTAYFERIAKDRLATVMEMEADRMVNLNLSETGVVSERDVVLEERRLRVENDPASLLNEQMSAALHLSHPYGRPIIGWAEEIRQIGRPEALDFYAHHYGPNNATLVVVGDVEPAEVRRLAQEKFGALKPRELAARTKPAVAPRVSGARISFASPDAKLPQMSRIYRVPSYVTGAPGTAESLEVLAEILGGGATSRLYRTLVIDKMLAAEAGAWYSGTARGPGEFSVWAVPRDGVSFEAIEREIDAVIAGMRLTPPRGGEFTRAKTGLIASDTYERDNQFSLAMDYGQALTVGLTIEDVEQWASRVEKVTEAQVRDAARSYLIERESVTGFLTPGPAMGAAP